MNPPDTADEGVSFDARVVLRPRSLDESLDLALAYGREHRGDFLRLAAFLLVPAIALVAAARVGWDLTWAETWAVVFVVAPLLERSVITFAGRHLFGNEPRIAGAVGAAFRRPFSALFAALMIPLPWLPVLLTNFDNELLIGLGVMAVVFWPFLLAWFLYCSVVLVLEGVKLGALLRRAGLLISYRYGRAIGFVIFTTAIRVLAVFSFDLTARFVVTFVLQLGEPLDTLTDNGGSWAAVFGYLAIAPYVALARLFDYVDARTRLEGWDIQVRFKAIAAKARRERERVAA
jgi:hypothetical protein